MNIEPNAGFWTGIGVAVAALAWAQTVRYELRDDALCICYGRLCVRRVFYRDIESVRRGGALWNEHYNRFSFDPNLVLRLKRAPIARNLMINPPRTEEFLAKLGAKMDAARSD